MTLRIDRDGHDAVRLTAADLEARPSGTVAFAVEGTATITGEMLEAVAGATLTPERVEVGVDDSGPVSIDLGDETPAALRPESVDVGIATPDADDLTPDPDPIRSAVEPGTGGDGVDAADVRPNVLAFTVDGIVHGVTDETLEVLSSGSPTLEALVFAVEGGLATDDGIRSDGGATDPVFELTLFGHGIVVNRDGTIVVGSGGPPDATGLL